MVKRLFVEGDKAGNTIICMNKLNSSGIKTLYGIGIITVSGNSGGKLMQISRTLRALNYGPARGTDINAGSGYLNHELTDDVEIV